MKKTLTILLYFLAFGVYAQIIKEDTLKLETEEATLEGSLIVPQQFKKGTLVVFVAGSGPTDRNGNSGLALQSNAYKMIAEQLAYHNIASFRYDKIGSGKSKMKSNREDFFQFEGYVNHAVGFVQLLKKDKRFTRIYIVGHSEGSLVGMLAAQQTKIKGFVSLAGAGRPIDLVLKEQLKMLPSVLKEEAYKYIERIKKGDTISKPNPLLGALFRPSVQPFLTSWMRYDPALEIKKMSCKLLILQGSTDIQVAISEAELLHSAVSKAQYRLIEGMNHILKAAPAERNPNIATYTKPELPLHSQLMAALLEFIN